MIETGVFTKDEDYMTATSFRNRINPHGIRRDHLNIDIKIPSAGRNMGENAVVQPGRARAQEKDRKAGEA